jgi:Na+/pantothenate symporter
MIFGYFVLGLLMLVPVHLFLELWDHYRRRPSHTIVKKVVVTGVAAASVDGADAASQSVKDLYFRLNTLDSKVSSLLRVDAILIAIFAVLATLHDGDPFLVLLDLFGIVLAGLAAVPCFLALWVWFVADETNAQPSEIEMLRRKAAFRKRSYRIAYFLAVLPGLYLGVVVGVDILGEKLGLFDVRNLFPFLPENLINPA